MDSLHSAVLASFHQRRKGGAVVSCGDKCMIAVEFFGPYGNNGGASVEMVYVDHNPMAQAVVRGRKCVRATELGTAFLAGETVEYIETKDEKAFLSLLSKYLRGSTTNHYIDIKSGLKIYETNISK